MIEMVGDGLVEVQLTAGRMLEYILTPDNLNRAYRQVKANTGSGGIDRMDVGHLLPYLRSHKGEIVESLLDGKYRPNPVRRVEIPKDGGSMRQLGIPTVVDRVIQQAVPKWQAWQWANSRKGYCRVAHSFMQRVATDEKLRRAGYPCLMDYYVKMHPC